MSKQSYVRFRADGGFHGQVDLDHELTLEEMQWIVGGYIERVQVRYHGKTLDMWVNEEGLVRNLPINLEASLIAGQTIVGDAFIIL